MSKGKHFVIGDLHGDVSRLKAVETIAGIDIKNDYIYLLGDLRITTRCRNPLSVGSIKSSSELSNYVARKMYREFGEPGYYIIRGNHDHLHASGKSKIALNGFGNLTEQINDLPELMIIDLIDKRYVLVHAGVPVQGDPFGISLLLEYCINQNSHMSAYRISYDSEHYRAVVGESGKKGIVDSFYTANRRVIEEDITIIHGHKPTQFLNGVGGYRQLTKGGVFYDESKNTYALDTGCGVVDCNEKLSCIRLEDMKIFTV